MKISLIGMSGSGKSYWAGRLQTQGFTRFCIDELIQEQLGLKDIHDMAAWLGFPYEPQHEARSQQYLELEEAVMREVLDTVSALPDSEDIVIDPTGSVIYLDKAILRALADTTTIFFLEAPATERKILYERYLKDPKPVIWGDKFHQAPNETAVQALSRSYSKLLDFRLEKYQALADHSLKREFRYTPGLTTQQFIDHLRTLAG